MSSPEFRDRLVALVVNYESGWFAESCVASLMYEWQREGRAIGDLQVIVVENASPSDQSGHMQRCEAGGALVLRSDENLGYARGMNWAYEHAHWPQSAGPRKQREFVALLNPDLVFLKDSVGNMLRFLTEHPEVGCLTPRAHIDPDKVIHLPRNKMPTPLDSLRINLAHRFAWAGRRYARKRFAQSLEWMQSEQPIDADSLSGACVFLRREIVEELGRPMDARYPLYFEDTDLFRELATRGYRTVHFPGAQVLHHWSRSAGVDTQFDGVPAQRYRISQARYFEKFYGKLGAWFVARIDRIGARWARRGSAPIFPVIELEPSADAPLFAWKGERKVVIEMGLTPNWLIAAGTLTEGSSWRFPEATWEWLFQGRYYFRAVDRETGEMLGAWRVDKTSPARLKPITVEELHEMALMEAHA